MKDKLFFSGREDMAQVSPLVGVGWGQPILSWGPHLPARSPGPGDESRGPERQDGILTLRRGWLALRSQAQRRTRCGPTALPAFQMLL